MFRKKSYQNGEIRIRLGIRESPVVLKFDEFKGLDKPVKTRGHISPFKNESDEILFLTKLHSDSFTLWNSNDVYSIRNNKNQILCAVEHPGQNEWDSVWVNENQKDQIVLGSKLHFGYLFLVKKPKSTNEFYLMFGTSGYYLFPKIQDNNIVINNDYWTKSIESIDGNNYPANSWYATFV